MGKKFKDLTRMKFGRLAVICREGTQISPSGSKKVLWKCLCDCQLDKPEEERNYTYVTTFHLTKKNGTVSCGCYQKDVMSKIKSKTNNYDLTGEYGIGYTYNTDSYGRNEFYFDLEDYDKIKDYCWHFTNGDYLLAYKRTCAAKERILLHKIIMNDLKKEHVIDHIHGRKTRNDNRKGNLRIASNSTNGMNKGLISSNKSGVTGVCWRKDISCWMAYIKINQKNIYLGNFAEDDFESAVKARKEAEEKYFGEFSYDNSQAM